MQYLSTDITTFHRQCQTPNKQKSYFDTSSSTFQQQTNDFNKNRGFQSEQCPKAYQNTPQGNQMLTSYNNYSVQIEISEQSQQEWPQIKQIVKKICEMQTSVVNQRRINKQLNGKLRLYEMKIETYQLQIKRVCGQLDKKSKKHQSLLDELNLQRENLREKDEQLLKSKETISDIQINQLKRIGQIQQKLKKSNIENKQLLQKLRRSNTELQKQRNLNKQLKKDMNSKIENIQSSKQSYLIKEIQSLKQIINSSQDQKQFKYLLQITELNRKIYQYEEEIKIRNIQINLMERKKQQEIKDICEKKDKQIKVQKAMSKTLNEKLAKMQGDMNKLKKQNTDASRNNRIQATQKNQEQFLLELSPQKC